jgi:hypothetical protein
MILGQEIRECGVHFDLAGKVSENCRNQDDDGEDGCSLFYDPNCQ